MKKRKTVFTVSALLRPPTQLSLSLSLSFATLYPIQAVLVRVNSLATMHLSTLSLLPLLASTGLAFNCTREAFADILPSNASVSFTRSIPVDGNSTFVVPAGDIAYPTSPTGLQPLCAVQINVSSSDCSAYSFGL